MRIIQHSRLESSSSKCCPGGEDDVKVLPAGEDDEVKTKSIKLLIDGDLLLLLSTYFQQPTTENFE